MEPEIQTILSKLSPLGKGVADETLEQCEQFLGFPLPDDYGEFFLMSNGASGMIGQDNWLHLYSIEEVIKGKDDYSEFVHGYIQIGSNGGSTGYFLSGEDDDKGKFVQFDLYDLDLNAIEYSAESFSELLLQLNQ